MTDATNSKGPAPATAPIERQPIPVSEIKPEDLATLSIEYRGGEPVIIARGGTFIPEALSILDDSGNPVARMALPRPLILVNAAFHVGAYGEGDWANARPLESG
ncbi:hypothetical protein [Streptomyces sp. NPDC001205]